MQLVKSMIKPKTKTIIICYSYTMKSTRNRQYYEYYNSHNFFLFDTIPKTGLLEHIKMIIDSQNDNALDKLMKSKKSYIIIKEDDD